VMTTSSPSKRTSPTPDSDRSSGNQDV
jgi:hypothetical protein